MAQVKIYEEKREITEPQEISDFLEQYGIHYEKWDVEGRVDAEASNEEILDAYASEIGQLKRLGSFVTADVINVTPETPDLDAMLAKFSKEHTHSEDEIRFTVKGNGLFHIHPDNAPVFAIQVESGDLINVPAGTKHWFDLCSDRTIRCIRLFEDMSGWTPHYVDDSVHADYTPVCMGPAYLAANTSGIEPVVEV